MRDASIEELLSRLKELGLILDEESFYLYAENCISPEELVDFIWIDIEEEDNLKNAFVGHLSDQGEIGIPFSKACDYVK